MEIQNLKSVVWGKTCSNSRHLLLKISENVREEGKE